MGRARVHVITGPKVKRKIRCHSKEKRSQSITEAFIHIHTATVETYMCANLYLLGSFCFGKWGSKFNLKHTFDECKGCFYIILPYPCVAEVWSSEIKYLLRPYQWNNSNSHFQRALAHTKGNRRLRLSALSIWRLWNDAYIAWILWLGSRLTIGDPIQNSSNSLGLPLSVFWFI